MTLVENCSLQAGVPVNADKNTAASDITRNWRMRAIFMEQCKKPPAINCSPSHQPIPEQSRKYLQCLETGSSDGQDQTSGIGPNGAVTTTVAYGHQPEHSCPKGQHLGGSQWASIAPKGPGQVQGKKNSASQDQGLGTSKQPESFFNYV